MLQLGVNTESADGFVYALIVSLALAGFHLLWFFLDEIIAYVPYARTVSDTEYLSVALTSHVVLPMARLLRHLDCLQCRSQRIAASSGVSAGAIRSSIRVAPLLRHPLPGATLEAAKTKLTDQHNILVARDEAWFRRSFYLVWFDSLRYTFPFRTDLVDAFRILRCNSDIPDAAAEFYLRHPRTYSFEG